MERNEAEQDLIGLLQRALKSVPFLRLDKSDEVLEKFRSACALLEENLVEDYSLSDLDNAENGEDDSAFGRVVRRSPTNASRYAHDSGDEEEKHERDRGVSASKRMDIPVLDRKVTTDYSSPSLGRRSLKPGASEVEKAEEFAPKKGPSSRAQAGQSARAAATLGFAAGGAKKSSTARPPANPIPVKRGATEDYMSPNLMGRSLAGKRPAVVAKKVRGPEPEEEDELYEEEVPTYKAPKSISALPNPMEKVKRKDAPSIVEAPHSPLQLSASRRLLELSGGAKVENVNSPKPAFLRRLDSPATHSGALLAKRKDLTKMIRRAVAAVPYLKMPAFGKVKDALTEAVLALEASTTRDSPDGISE